MKYLTNSENSLRPFAPLLLVGTLVLLLGCDDKIETELEPQIRAIKYTVLGELAGDQERRIAGVVTAAVTSNVAFEISGQVADLPRKSGDRVKKGEVIARLDAGSYELQVAKARNALAQEQANLNDAQFKFDQLKQLRSEGFTAQSTLDSAEATLKNAQGAVGVAKSQLNLASRDLAKTNLKAPFEGVIARKMVEVFEDVKTGQAIYALQTETRSKIEASLPETLINKISLGTKVIVSFPPLGGATATGRVDEMSPLTGDANAYPIQVALDAAPDGLRPGMSAEVAFTFASDDTGKAFIVPMSAVLADAKPGGDGDVFVFNPDTRELQKRAIAVVNVRNNQLQVTGDLAEGEIIATGGVSFLHDGMRVELFDPAVWR